MLHHLGFTCIVKRIALLFFFLPIVTLSLPAKAQSGSWDDSFALPGIGGFNSGSSSVTDSFSDSVGNTYVVGNFNFADDIETGSIAKWDGSSWSSVGDSLGDNAILQAITVADNGDVYVAGFSLDLGGTHIDSPAVLKWDSTDWTIIGEVAHSNGFGFASVLTLEVASNNTVYAGGQFTSIDGIDVDNIAQWNGASWTGLNNGTNATVRGLAIDTASANEDLWVVGDFETVGNIAASRVAKWDGTNWSALSTGISGQQVHQAVTDGSGNLFVSGNFFSAGNLGSARNIAMWDGSAWNNLSGGLAGGPRIRIAWSDTDGLYAVSENSVISSVNLWDGTNWTVIGNGEHLTSPRSISVNSNGVVIIGGFFSAFANVVGHNVMQWDGTAWTPVTAIPDAKGLNAIAIAGASDEVNGIVYIGGEFTNFNDDIGSNLVAKWDGINLTAVGTTDSHLGASGRVTSMNVTENGEIFIAGHLNITDSAASNTTSFAHWNGSDWIGLSSPNYLFIGSNNTTLDQTGGLYASTFVGIDDATSTLTTAIERWDGNTWTVVTDSVEGQVNALYVDTNGDLYVGGDFTAINGVALSNIARWDGSNWNSLGTGTDRTVSVFEAGNNGELLVGGSFDTVDGIATSKLASWNAGAWTAIINNSIARVEAIAVSPDNKIYITGDVYSNGQNVRVAVLENNVLSGLAEGIENGIPQVLQLDVNGNLLVGGQFGEAGAKASSAIALWKPDVIVSKPSIRSHQPDSQLSASTETFAWSGNGTAVDEWWVYAGSSVGGSQYFDEGNLGSAVTVDVTALPTDGSTVYVRLWYRAIGGTWLFADFQYQAAIIGNTAPEVTDPVEGTHLTGASQVFNWSANTTTVSEWWLYAGSSTGAFDYFNSGNLGDDLNVSVNGLPIDGSTVYARLWYKVPGLNWQSIDTSYTAADLGRGPSIDSPTTGTILSGSNELFTWSSNDVNVGEWWLFAGSAQGSSNFYDSSNLGSVTSTVVTGLPTNGSTVHVRLWYRESGSSWSFFDSQFTAANLLAITLNSSNANGVLTSTSDTFNWSDANGTVTAWWLYVGSSVNGNNYEDSGKLSAATTNHTTNDQDLPPGSVPVYVRLWFQEGVGTNWQFIDKVFTSAP